MAAPGKSLVNDPKPRGVHFPFMKRSDGLPSADTPPDIFASNIKQILLTTFGERCLTGDTKISLLSGEEIPIEELVKKPPFWVYSFDTHTGKLVPGFARAFQTSVADKVLEVELDNGQKVRCTPEHLWLRRSGEYVRASDLRTGDSLMPLYRKTSDVQKPIGYEMSHTGTETWAFTHRLVAEFVGGHEGDRRVVHHVNGVKSDNRPENLKWVSGKEHRVIHRNLVACMNTPEVKEKAKEALRRKWQNDPIWAEKMRNRLSDLRRRTNQTPKEAERLKTWSHEMGKRLWSDPKYAEARERCLRLMREGSIRDFAKGDASKSRMATRRRWISTDPKDKASCSRTIASATKTICKLNASGEAIRRRVLASAKRFKAQGGIFCVSEWEKWREGHPKKGVGVPRWETLLRYNPTLGNRNHKVVNVQEIVISSIPVYDLQVEKFNNFAISAGVFVHNCMRPSFGSGLKGVTFSSIPDSMLLENMKLMVRRAIETWEPRVRVQSVDVYSSDTTITVKVNYLSGVGLGEVGLVLQKEIS
jgi:DNA gyrase subunit B